MKCRESREATMQRLSNDEGDASRLSSFDSLGLEFKIGDQFLQRPTDAKMVFFSRNRQNITIYFRKFPYSGAVGDLLPLLGSQDHLAAGRRIGGLGGW